MIKKKRRNEMKKNISIVLILVMTMLCLCSCQSDDGADYLVLVNKSNPIDSGFVNTISLTEAETVYEEGVLVENTALTAYQELKEVLLDEGIEIGIDSAYRSVEKQEEIMKEFTEEYGEEYAKATVAEPGTSEHHTGLAIDIVPRIDGEWVVENEDMMKETKVFAAIHEKLAEYGFIVRYPDGKESITGYSYEPWHLRYVGVDAAKEITDAGITLEEYLEKE